ncbi:Transmembrane protein 87A [Rhynchospora pubera]|uniref:Transmembrane protein 87A n=1 Tax=Rhynchospora pubera TaxID=906938 RepID=A0AAV8FJ47_9POAL|nr:Transmembrane protein 87A [Rhynchospora pubera]
MAPKPSLVVPLMVIFLSLLSLGAKASVHDYKGQKFVSSGNAFILHGGSEGLFASHFSFNSSEPNGGSFIRFEKITVKRSHELTALNKSSSVYAIMFEVLDRDTLGGSAYGGQKAICCTPDLSKLGACTEGTIIYHSSNHSNNWPQLLTATFKPGETEAAIPSETIRIAQTGMYNLYFIYCDPDFEGVLIEGKTIWKNPSGYLPGRMAPLMMFYGLMSLAFVALGAYWFYQYSLFWRDVMPLQNCITLVITLGMLETTLWYFDFTEFNVTGIRPAGTTFWAATFGTIRKTLSRALILLVSMGFGVVKPTLGGITSKVLLLSGTFFVASEVLELVENVGIVSDQSAKAKLLFVFPVAMLDAVFVIWIFTSLTRTLNKLQARRMTAKLEMYRKFTNALVVATVVSLGWIGYEIYFRLTDVYNEKWQTAWVIPALWQVISFSVLCVICSLWAPSQNSTRFTYSEDGIEDFDYEELHSPARHGSFSLRDSWSYSLSQDATKVILRSDSIVYKVTDLDEEDKRE